MNFNLDPRVGHGVPAAIWHEIDNGLHAQTELGTESLIDFSNYVNLLAQKDSHRDYLERNFMPSPAAVQMHSHAGERESQKTFGLTRITPEAILNPARTKKDPSLRHGKESSEIGYQCLVEDCNFTYDTFSRLLYDHLKKRKDAKHREYWVLNKDRLQGIKLERKELKAKSQELAKNSNVRERYYCLVKGCEKSSLTFAHLLRDHVKRRKDAEHQEFLNLYDNQLHDRKQRDALKKRSLALGLRRLNGDQDLIASDTPLPTPEDKLTRYSCPVEDCLHTTPVFSRLIHKHLERKRDLKHMQYWEFNGTQLKNRQSKERESLAEQSLIYRPNNQAMDTINLLAEHPPMEDQETRDFKDFLQTINSTEGIELITFLKQSFAQQPISLATNQEQALEHKQPERPTDEFPLEGLELFMPEPNYTPLYNEGLAASSWELPIKNHEELYFREERQAINSSQGVSPIATYLKSSTAHINSPTLSRRVAVQPAQFAKRQKRDDWE